VRKHEFDRHIVDTEKLYGVERTPEGYRAELDRLADLKAEMPDYGSKYSPQALLEHRRGIVESKLAAALPEAYAAAAAITTGPTPDQLRAVASALRAFPTTVEAAARPSLRPSLPAPMSRAAAKTAEAEAQAIMRRGRQ
jgi:hypothetical protein